MDDNLTRDNLIKENLIREILKSKEDRRVFQTRLIEKYKNTLISFTLNIPGPEKDQEKYRKIHKYAMDYIMENLEENKINILYWEIFEKTTGSEGYILVEKNSLDIKKLMIKIEETHPLGRLFDVDVFDRENQQVGRKDLNIEARKCLICSQDARVCMRERNHSQEDLIEKVNKLIKNYLGLTIKENCEIIDV